MSETPNPGFLQDLEKKADAFFEHIKEEVNHVIHPDTDPVAAAAAQIAAQGAEPHPNDASATESATVPAIAEAEVGGPNAASAAVEHTTEPASAPSAAGSATGSPSVENSAAEPSAPLTFEQMVEARFLKLEAAFVQLPKSIHAVTSAGSLETEDFGKAVLAHVFAHI